MSEPLENEIEEELRKKQLKALWDRFGLYLIAVILIIIIIASLIWHIYLRTNK